MTEPTTSLRAIIADPAQGLRVAEVMSSEVARIIASIQTQDVSSNIPFSIAEAMRRITVVESAAAGLAEASALAGVWAPESTARLWPPILATLLGAQNRGSGLVPWLQLLPYPALLMMYAFGVGATIARRYQQVAAILTAP